MKNYKSDILAERPEMGKMPYSMPKGYFDKFKTSAYRLSGAEKASRGQRKAGIFISTAASVAAALILGAYFIFGFNRTDDFTQEDLLVFDEAYINAEYYTYSEKQEQSSIAEAEYSADDIIDFLIYSGVSLEEIETFK